MYQLLIVLLIKNKMMIKNLSGKSNYRSRNLKGKYDCYKSVNTFKIKTFEN